MTRPSVLLADDHQIVLDGLRRILQQKFEIVGAVKDGRALIAASKRLRPDVVVVDISMPILNGIEAVAKLRKAEVQSKVIFLTMHSEVTYAIRAFEVGASGFVVKHSAYAELETAIFDVLKGKKYVSPDVADGLMHYSKRGLSRKHDPINKLTLRQREVLQLLAEGCSAKKVANILHISPRTAEFHKYRIMEYLNVRSNAELVQFAVKHGIVWS